MEWRYDWSHCWKGHKITLGVERKTKTLLHSLDIEQVRTIDIKIGVVFYEASFVVGDATVNASVFSSQRIYVQDTCSLVESRDAYVIVSRSQCDIVQGPMNVQWQIPL